MRKTLAALALAGTLVFGAACKETPKEYTIIKGTVFSERYRPSPSGLGMSWTPSNYSFSLETQNGKKTFEVEDEFDRSIKKERIHDIIELGADVEVKVEKGIENQTFFKVVPSRIEIRIIK